MFQEENKASQPALPEQLKLLCFELCQCVVLEMDTKQHFRETHAASIFRVEDYSFTLNVEDVPDRTKSHSRRQLFPNKLYLYK
jgi:hypothetical protein